jgi:hypothetical protein
MTFEPCHSPAADAVSFMAAALDLDSFIGLLFCAIAGAAIRAEPSTAAATNLESIFILLKGCLTRN